MRFVILVLSLGLSSCVQVSVYTAEMELLKNLDHINLSYNMLLRSHDHLNDLIAAGPERSELDSESYKNCKEFTLPTLPKIPELPELDEDVTDTEIAIRLISHLEYVQLILKNLYLDLERAYEEYIDSCQ